MELKDSGSRTAFVTGAVRDCKEGNGRCDLMPLDQIARILASEDGESDPVIMRIYKFYAIGSSQYLIEAVQVFIEDVLEVNLYEGMLELSHHFRDGAEKYGEHNWEKGIPVSSFIDSAVRHYLKFKSGRDDEPHDRAFIWNLTCAAWTMRHHPELDDYTLTAAEVKK